MRIPAEFRVGSATHTGLVRSANEDDYLVIAPPDRRPFALVAAIADGMGGVAGGGEASRTALRGLAAGLLAEDDGSAGTAGDLEQRVIAAFGAAWARVREQAQLVPALREMGTTLTVLVFAGQHAVLGHVGDSRAYLLRGGELRQLSVDHTARERGSQLLRCIGGGLPEQPPDTVAFDLAPGDRLLVCSDGVWGPVGDARLQDALARLQPGSAAERMVSLALAAGGPDNGTALVVHFVGAGAEPAAEVEATLPLEEASRLGDLTRQAGRLGAARWPWFLLLLLAAVVIAAVVARWVTGFDALLWLRAIL